MRHPDQTGKALGSYLTEAEWLTATDPTPILETWTWAVSERKMRLFACACCRRIWRLLTAPESRTAVEVSERLADGRAREARRAATHDAAARITRRERAHAPAAAEQASGRIIPEYRKTVAVAKWAGRTAYYAHEAAYADTYHTKGTNDRAAFNAGNVARDAEKVVQVALLHDIFGNPFRPFAFSPQWRTDTTVLLARQMYDSSDFSAMPILADALQDGGCDNDDILNHCRDTKQTHVRGCWVVDLVLGKE